MIAKLSSAACATGPSVAELHERAKLHRALGAHEQHDSHYAQIVQVDISIHLEGSVAAAWAKGSVARRATRTHPANAHTLLQLRPLAATRDRHARMPGSFDLLRSVILRWAEPNTSIA